MLVVFVRVMAAPSLSAPPAATVRRPVLLHKGGPAAVRRRPPEDRPHESQKHALIRLIYSQVPFHSATSARQTAGVEPAWCLGRVLAVGCGLWIVAPQPKKVMPVRVAQAIETFPDALSS